MKPIFALSRSGGKAVPLNTIDLLTAVRQSIEVEGDLFMYEEIIVSWLSCSLEENLERLDELGICSYIANQQTCFKYKDEKRNTSEVFMFISPLQAEGSEEINIFIQDYEFKNDPGEKFESLEVAVRKLQERYLKSLSTKINVINFCEGSCRRAPLFAMTEINNWLT